MINPLFESVSRSIVQEIDPEKIFIFGSYAKNEQREDSDLDIMVVLKDIAKYRRSRLNIITSLRKALMEINIPKDILVFDEKEIEEWKNSQNHIISRALNNGICLYERS